MLLDNYICVLEQYESLLKTQRRKLVPRQRIMMRFALLSPWVCGSFSSDVASYVGIISHNVVAFYGIPYL